MPVFKPVEHTVGARPIRQVLDYGFHNLMRLNYEYFSHEWNANFTPITAPLPPSILLGCHGS